MSESNDRVLTGAGEIARLTEGDDSEKSRRRVYHKHSIGALPTFIHGGQIKMRTRKYEEELREAEAVGEAERAKRLEEKRVKRAERARKRKPPRSDKSHSKPKVPRSNVRRRSMATASSMAAE